MTENITPAVRVRASRFNLEIGALKGFATIEEAREIALALKIALAEDKGIRIYETGTFRKMPLVAPAPLRVTRNKQGAEGTGMTLAKNVRTALNITDPDAFGFILKLDEDTRTWGVDYKAMVEAVKAFPSDEFNREERVAAFQKAVSDTLAAEALRGISMK